MINRIRKIGKNRFVLTALLLAFIGLGYFSLLRGNNISFRAAFSDLLHSYFWMLFFSFILNRIHTFYHSRSAISVVHISIIAIFSLLVSAITNWYAQWIAGQDKVYFDFLENTFFVRWFILFLLLFVIVQQLWIDKHLQEQNAAFTRLTEKERQLARAEMNNLQQQFRPHFLFNSLNSISALVKLEPENARKMIFNLSDFLRKTIHKGKDDFNSVSDEIDYLENYLAIEKVRFGERLQVSIRCDANCLEWQIPSLILQPLLENAIKYGVNGVVGEVLIALEIKCVNEELAISISNQFDPSAVMSGGTGFGLKSVERKLGLLYQRSDLMRINIENERFIVNLKIPKDAKSNSH